jgi:hypothetical protein
MSSNWKAAGHDYINVGQNPAKMPKKLEANRCRLPSVIRHPSSAFQLSGFTSQVSGFVLMI